MDDSAPAPARTYTAPSADGPDYGSGELKTPETPNAETGSPEMFDDLPLSLWAEANEGMPYSADYFNLQNYFNDETFLDMANDMLYLDWYVQNKIAENQLTDSQASFEQIIGEIISEIGKYPTEKSSSVFQRVVEAAKALTRLESVKIKPEAAKLTVKEIEDIHGSA